MGVGVVIAVGVGMGGSWREDVVGEGVSEGWSGLMDEGVMEVQVGPGLAVVVDAATAAVSTPLNEVGLGKMVVTDGGIAKAIPTTLWYYTTTI